MGCWTDHVVPRIINVACGMKISEPLRRRVCADLSGDVVEIGFGSGLNVEHYPPTVTSVTAVDPSDVGWKLAHHRVGGSPVPITRAGLDGAVLPFEDDSFDAALSTWTMCTIPDIELALAELRRVLKPGGELHFVEHGLAPDEGVRRRQRRLEPLNKRLIGGCHLTQRIDELITGSGFELRELDRFYEEGAPKPLAADYLGVAVNPPPEAA